MGCHVCEIIDRKDDRDLIFETDFWGVLLSFNQRYLGRCYIFSKRHFGSMSNMTEEENVDFLEVVKKLEKAIKKTFGATMFNWSCLMNNFYKKENPDPHVHWHMRPRYRDKVLVSGKSFEDGEFGHHYSRDDYIVESEEIRLAIVKEIQKNL
jgi:diadenosine tetraphosphate (Ap4A) HIT family hydrolase